MFIETYGDALKTATMLVDERDVMLVHQVNCQGVMASGIAKQIKERFPCHFDDYEIDCNERDPSSQLGEIVVTEMEHLWDNTLHIVGMFAQDNFGRQVGNVYTDYIAFEDCLQKLSDRIRKRGFNGVVIFPKNIGCGLGGGDWKLIHHMISSFAVVARVDVMVVDYYTGDK